MFVWPPKSHQKQDFWRSPVWPFIRTHMQMTGADCFGLMLSFPHLSVSPPLAPTQSSEHETDGMCSQSSEPNKQHIFGENTEHKALVLTKKTCTSAK